MTKGIGDRSQEETKYSRLRMPRGGLDWKNKPEIYKTYPKAARIPLPEPKGGDIPLDIILKTRKSIRHF